MNDRSAGPSAYRRRPVGANPRWHGPALTLYAAKWTDAADDCVQVALVELARQPVRPENVVAWVYRVVKHRALNAARSAERRRVRESHAMAERLHTEVVDLNRVDDATLRAFFTRAGNDTPMPPSK